jgi:hypothetical protein
MNAFGLDREPAWQFWSRCSSVKAEERVIPAVIACDKREAFAQGSEATKQPFSRFAALWIASRSLSSGARSRDPFPDKFFPFPPERTNLYSLPAHSA